MEVFFNELLIANQDDQNRQVAKGMVISKCTDSHLYVHELLNQVFEPKFESMTKDAAFLVLRLLYGEFIGKNVYDWLVQNPIKKNVL